MKTITIKDVTISLSDNDIAELKKQLEEKPKFPKWEDIVRIDWYSIDCYWESTYAITDSESANWLRPTKELCEASIALAKLLYLRDLCNDWWVADWETDGYKWCIYQNKNELHNDIFTWSKKLLSFKDEETRDWFLEAYKDLITIALPLI